MIYPNRKIILLLIKPLSQFSLQFILAPKPTNIYLSLISERGLSEHESSYTGSNIFTSC